MSDNLKSPFDGARKFNRNTKYEGCGFDVDPASGELVYLIARYEIADRTGTAVFIEYEGFDLTAIEMEAKNFEAKFGPEDKIFAPTPEDYPLIQNELGYVCYQMQRRLDRLRNEIIVGGEIIMERLILDSLYASESCPKDAAYFRQIPYTNSVVEGRYYQQIKHPIIPALKAA